MFNKLVVVACALVAAQTVVAAPQLNGLIPVCLTIPGPLNGVLPSGFDLLECPTGVDCVAPALPIIGGILTDDLPLGVSDIL